MNIDISTPFSNIFDGEFTSFYIDTKDGCYDILPNHMECVFDITDAKIILTKKDKSKLKLLIRNSGLVKIEASKILVKFFDYEEIQ